MSWSSSDSGGGCRLLLMSVTYFQCFFFLFWILQKNCWDQYHISVSSVIGFDWALVKYMFQIGVNLFDVEECPVIWRDFHQAARVATLDGFLMDWVKNGRSDIDNPWQSYCSMSIQGWCDCNLTFFEDGLRDGSVWTPGQLGLRGLWIFAGKTVWSRVYFSS